MTGRFCANWNGRENTENFTFFDCAMYEVDDDIKQDEWNSSHSIRQMMNLRFSDHPAKRRKTAMRCLMLLGILMVVGCSRAAIREPVNEEPNPKSELQQLEDRLGI